MSFTIRARTISVILLWKEIVTEQTWGAVAK